jgi:hypothetical protein
MVMEDSACPERGKEMRKRNAATILEYVRMALFIFMMSTPLLPAHYIGVFSFAAGRPVSAV